MEKFYETPELVVVEVCIPSPLMESGGTGTTEGGGSGGDDIIIP